MQRHGRTQRRGRSIIANGNSIGHGLNGDDSHAINGGLNNDEDDEEDSGDEHGDMNGDETLANEDIIENSHGDGSSVGIMRHGLDSSEEVLRELESRYFLYFTDVSHRSFR